MTDTEALRKKVIDLAIQGKLTEQLPSDGDAEDLYAQIQEEKAKLIKEKKIKKEKPLPEITDDEIPFEIPKNWKWVRLTSIYFQVGNKDKQIQSNELLSKGDFPAISQGKKYIDGWCNDTNKVIDNVPLVLFGDHTKNVKYIDTPFVVCADGTQLLKPIVIDCRYFYYVITYLSDLIDDRGYSRHFSLLKKTLLPLPPLTEQNRIIEKLDKVLSQIDEIDTLQEKYSYDLTVLKNKIIDAGIQGKLTEQLPSDGDAETLYAQIQEEKAKLIKEGKIKKEKPLPEIEADEIPFEIPKNWKWTRLQEIALTIVDCPHSTPKYYEETTSYYAIDTNCIDENGDITGLRNVDENDYYKRISRLEPALGDIVYTREGSICRASVLPSHKKICLGQRVMLIRCPDILDVYYIKRILMAQQMVRILTLKQRGIGVNHVNVGDVCKLVIPLPPLAEQKRISEKIDAIMEQLG